MNVLRMAQCLALAAGALVGSSAMAQYTVSLQSTGDCTSGSVDVKLVLTSAPPLSQAAGGQFFLSFDAGFTGTTITAGLGLQAVFTNINNAAHQATLAVGAVNNGQVISQGDTLATIHFTDSTLYCAQSNLVTFRASLPPSRLTDALGNEITISTGPLGALTLNDTVAPTFTFSPPNVVIECNVNPTVANTGGPATATDNCGSALVSFTDSAPIFVSPSNLNGWSIFATLANSNTPGGDGTFNFVTGPATPPIGTGSVHLNTGSSGEQTVQMRNGDWSGTPLSSLTTLGYSTYGTSWNGGQMTYLTLYIDLDGDLSNGYEDRIFFEPEYSRAGYGNPFNVSPQPAPVLGVWQTWDCLHGMWYGENDFGPGQDARPLSMYLALHPTARIVNQSPAQVPTAGQGSIRIAAGFASPGDVFDVNVDNFQISTASSGAVYNFDPNAFPCVDNTIARTWKAVDSCNNTSTYVQIITQRDTTAPVITCPPNVVTNADAGGCTATFNYINTFDVSPTLSNSQAPGVWYTDRYAPAGFASASFLGGNRLKQSVSSADSLANRVSPYNFPFYSTQGRKLDINLAAGQTLAVDLYIPAAWATSVRAPSMWATAFDATNSVSGFPIINFISNDPADPLNPTPANPTPRYRVFDDVNGVYIDLAMPVVFNAWHTLSMTLTGGNWVYKIDGVTVQTLPANGSTRIGNVILQTYNFGQSYDVYWDNLLAGPQGPVATDNCSAPTVTYVRSDNALLTLADPFPSGTTNVTWTATDCAGNASSCVQTVTVNPVNSMNVAVDEVGLSSAVTRCVTFSLYHGCSVDATVDVPVSFNASGQGTGSATVPCGAPYTSITATDQKHTLRRTSAGAANFGISGTAYYADFTAASGKALEQGNTNNDPYIDILDFGVFIGQLGTSPGGSTPCGLATNNADFSGNGTVGTEDFTFIQFGFLNFREADICNVPLADGGPVSDISVDELVARDMRAAAMADFNLDGRLNAADIAWVSQHGLPRCPADFNDDQVTDVSDIFSFLTAWFANHPKADFNGNNHADVQDIFSFLEVWFQGC